MKTRPTGKTVAKDQPFSILHILSDEVRLKIVRILAENGELCARDILTHFPITQPTLSHHMNVLLENHIVKARKSGRWVFYRVDSDALRMLISYLTKLLATADDTLSESSHEEEVPARREKRSRVPSRKITEEAIPARLREIPPVDSHSSPESPMAEETKDKKKKVKKKDKKKKKNKKK